MKNVLITGGNGFIGKNLVQTLKTYHKYNIFIYGKKDSQRDLEEYIKKADFIFHLAGVNRAKEEIDFYQGNTILVKNMLEIMECYKKYVPIVYSSSIQAKLDNFYGKSKKEAEILLKKWANKNNTPVIIYRFPNIFGKWCKPNYNSVIATFCYNIANCIPITVNNKNKEMIFAYIDDVIFSLIQQIQKNHYEKLISYPKITPVYNCTLGELSEKIYSFHNLQKTNYLPNFEQDFIKKLYATYLSYCDSKEIIYSLNKNIDQRGYLAEFIKSKALGQIFISTTKPGYIRGNHWHNTKTEKFLVIQGEAEIQLRNILESNIIRYFVSGKNLQVIDIPPGYSHALKNIGNIDLITIFYSSEIYNIKNDDTFPENI